MQSDELQQLRQQIDAANHDLIQALGRRFTLTRRVGELKKEADLPTVDPQRERELLKSVGSQAIVAGVSPELCVELFTQILSQVHKEHDAIKNGESVV